MLAKHRYCWSFVWTMLIVGCTAEQPATVPKLVSATMLREVSSEKGPTWEVIRIDDAATLARLESFFPGYRQRPASGIAAGWMKGYEIYFNFPAGESVRVSVAGKPQADVWTVGRGDFQIRGDFKSFADGL